ncbi:MAG: hypothetical protein WA130_22025 [Candidatus Methanoperedens sp.]
MLTEELRNFILKITEDYFYIKPNIIELPHKLNQRLREYFIVQLRTRKDKYAEQIFNKQIEYNRLDRILNRSYQYLKDKCGILNEDELHSFLKEIIDDILNQQDKWIWSDREKLENPVDEAIVQSMQPFSRYESSYNPNKAILELIELIEYGKRNNLFYWNGERWYVTNLGYSFIKLSPMQAVKFLMLLEIHQSGGNDDIWHFSKDYLNWIHETKTHYFNFEEPLDNNQIYVGQWIKRLSEMGVIECIRNYGGTFDEYELGMEIKVTKFGEVTLENVLDSEQDPLSTFVEMLYRQELNLSDNLFLHYSSSETIEKLRELFSDSEIIKGQNMDIEAGLKAYQDMNYISSLKTFIPVIEGIIRNIYIDNHIGGTDKDLEPMLLELKSKKWINKETESLINSLGRSKKVHGLEGTPQKEAQLYSTMALRALECLHKDYYFFEALRMSFKKITEEVEHLSEGNLLNAYPRKRDEIHVLVREHTLETKYRQIELICTLPKHKKVLSYKINLEKKSIEKSNGRFFEESQQNPLGLK